MTQLPENLQVIKTEQTPVPAPAYAKYPVPETGATARSIEQPQNNSNIKERLNLHVKRRLCAPPQASIKSNNNDSNNNNCSNQSVEQPYQPLAMVTATTTAAPYPAKPHNNQPKTRRHYQKRKEKRLSPTHAEPQNATPSEARASPVKFSNNSAKRPEGALPVLAVRKYKRRVLDCGGAEDNNATAASMGSCTINALAGDGGEEDSQDTEIRQCRGSDKDKRIDILSLVLSMKKRALLQHPEVQEMLQKVVALYKS